MGYMKLQGNEDNYEIDEIDCFEKPFGIVLDGMKKGYSNLFYMFLKMVQAYNIKEYLPIAPKSTIETEMFIKHNVLILVLFLKRKTLLMKLHIILKSSSELIKQRKYF